MVLLYKWSYSADGSTQCHMQSYTYILCNLYIHVFVLYIYIGCLCYTKSSKIVYTYVCAVCNAEYIVIRF